MSEEEIKELFVKYDVKYLNDKNGQSECYYCKQKHKYSLTWTSFLYEYEEHYYCYECLTSILLQQENKELKERIETLKELDLYTCEADYDYEENLELNYVAFSIEEFLEGDK